MNEQIRKFIKFIKADRPLEAKDSITKALNIKIANKIKELQPIVAKDLLTKK